MSTDPAFEGVGQKVGLEIWRIEKLKPVLQSKSTHGEFFSGDSYIVLSTKKQRNSPKLEWDIHFWLGSVTSQDEKGVAAYKTVELDDSLGGGPVQHREVQEHESRLFLSYFKNGIKYLEGGVDSGFKKVERGVYQKRLMHVKGKRNVRVKQVKLSSSSLNKGDVFILDDGLMLHVWNGPDSSRMERIKATEVARRIKDDERGGKAEIKIIDERWENDGPFFKALGDHVLPIPGADEAGDDNEFEKVAQNETNLYRVSDESGELEIKMVESKPFKKEDLDSEDCFILDTGSGGLYVWVGKKCTKNEKKQAWVHATDFLTKRGYPDWTPISQMVEGGETPLFKQCFKSWTDPGTTVGMGKARRNNKIAGYDSSKFDAKSLYMKKEIREEQLPDDGSGNIQIWRVENNDLIAQPENTYGIFYSGDCYVCLYTYRKGNRELFIIYFWQGSKSTSDERGASAIFAQRMDDMELDGMALQVRVVQGREPEHFLRIFQGKMIIFLGGVNNPEPDSDIRIFQVKGTNTFNTRAAQVLPRAASLNSNDVFIIDTDQNLLIWYGKGSSSEEKMVAKNLLSYLSPDSNAADIKEIHEGGEPDEFWTILGGKEEYATGKNFEDNSCGMPPRLFQCSNASGRFKVDEVVDFSQEDMDEDDVMILDTIDEVYVWIGKGANAIERKESLYTAMEYIKSDPSGRSPDNTVILQVKQGLEPPGFTGHFLGWDSERWSGGKTYEDLKQEMGNENVAATSIQEELAMFDKKHPYATLVKPMPPRGVDPTCKERYLTPEEFLQVFKMTYDQYTSLKPWKQAELKKKVQLKIGYWVSDLCAFLQNMCGIPA